MLVFLVSNIPRLVLNLTELLIHTTSSGASDCLFKDSLCWSTFNLVLSPATEKFFFIYYIFRSKRMWLRPNTRMVTESYNSIHCKMRSKLHKCLEHWEALFLWSWLNLWRWRTPLFKVSCHDQRQPSVSHHKQVSSIFFPFLFLKTPFTFLSQTPLLLSSHHRRMSLLGWQIKQILQLIVEIASVCDSCCAF